MQSAFSPKTIFQKNSYIYVVTLYDKHVYNNVKIEKRIKNCSHMFALSNDHVRCNHFILTIRRMHR